MDPAVCAEMSEYALFDLASTSMNLRLRPRLQKVAWVLHQLDQGAARCSGGMKTAILNFSVQFRTVHRA